VAVVNINDVLDGHVALDLDCLDRIDLNAYVPNLQVGGQVVTFLTQHLGHEVPSPALFKRIGDRFRQAVAAFAEANDIPLLRLKRPDRTRWDDRKLDHVRPHLEQAERDGRHRMVSAGRRNALAKRWACCSTAWRPGSTSWCSTRWPSSYAASKLEQAVSCSSLPSTTIGRIFAQVEKASTPWVSVVAYLMRRPGPMRHIG